MKSNGTVHPNAPAGGGGAGRFRVAQAPGPLGLSVSLPVATVTFIDVPPLPLSQKDIGGFDLSGTRNYSPNEVARFWLGVPYDPKYPYPKGKGAPNYVLQDGSLKTGYLVCSTYLNAAGTLWLTGKLRLGSAYFKRGQGRTEDTVDGFVKIGAKLKQQSWIGNKGASEDPKHPYEKGFDVAFRELSLSRDSFVAIAISKGWSAYSHHSAFAFWDVEKREWKVSHASQKKKKVVNVTLKEFQDYQPLKAVMAIFELSKSA